jgi:acyl-CoA thioester hydrolase
MTQNKIKASAIIQIQFYDLDPMNIVWHGNYARFLEQARCALLEKIGYSYQEMADSGYAYPIVDMRLKYIRPTTLMQKIEVEATLDEWENRIRISYLIRDAVSGEKLSKARTTQMAVEMESGETSFVCPDVLIRKVEACV